MKPWHKRRPTERRRSRGIVFASVLCVLVGALSGEARAGGRVTEEHFARLELLKQTRILSCEFREWQFKLEAKDKHDPGSAVEWVVKERGGRSDKRLLFIFDESKTSALLAAAELRKDELAISWTIAMGASPVEPQPFVLGALDGAIRLQAVAERPSEFCLPGSKRECFHSVLISARPQNGSSFPMIMPWFLDVDVSFVLAGFCRPGVSHDVARRLSSVRDPESCAESASSWGRYYMVEGISYLLEGEAAERSNVEAYKSFRIASDAFAVIRIPEDEDDYIKDDIIRRKRAGAFDTATAMAIAAEGMTPEQIAEAERLAAAWKPDPKRCETEPAAETSKKEP